MRLIDADKVKEILCGNCAAKDKIYCGYCKAGFDVDDVPTADVQKIDVRKIKKCCDEIADAARPLNYLQWGYIQEMLTEILEEIGYKEETEKE